ncbi:WxL protein host-binding domain-containing protein [Weissella confusa]
MTPDNGISGVMAGGVTFTAEGQADVNSQNATMNFNTEVGYTVAVLNRTSSSILVPNLTIGKASARVIASEAAISMQLINNTQTFLNSLYMRVSIVGPRGTYLQREASNMQMAPNSQFNYKVWAGEQDLPAGNYTVTAVGYYGREDGLRYDAPNGKRYAYRTYSKMNLTISDKTADKLHNQNAMLRKSIFWQPLFWMTIGVAVVLIVFFIWLLTRRRRVHYKFMLGDGEIIARGHVHLRRKGRATIEIPSGYMLVAESQDISSGQIVLKGTKLQNDFVVREG